LHLQRIMTGFKAGDNQKSVFRQNCTQNVARKERALKEVPLGGSGLREQDRGAGVFGNDNDGDHWFGDLVR